ncbi:helix-turn-helix transcriptional regulator [Actinoplanes sp. HUAS TT8]|uniref:helix-turn-helix transcriptional regulator n=1 Tax=Actinoplanes sp. HUAS TT8 TaxID=3447453 RepID=UPI003F5273BB
MGTTVMLMGAREIANRLGLSRQRVQQLADRDDFPAPFQTLFMGRVWLSHDIELWIRASRAGDVAAEGVADCPAAHDCALVEDEQLDGRAEVRTSDL